jgi:hypothetical protein
MRKPMLPRQRQYSRNLENNDTPRASRFFVFGTEIDLHFSCQLNNSTTFFRRDCHSSVITIVAQLLSGHDNAILSIGR